MIITYSNVFNIKSYVFFSNQFYASRNPCFMYNLFQKLNNILNKSIIKRKNFRTNSAKTSFKCKIGSENYEIMARSQSLQPEDYSALTEQEGIVIIYLMLSHIKK